MQQTSHEELDSLYSGYLDSFRAWASEAARLQELRELAAGSSELREAQERAKVAELAYHQSRQQLADFLISSTHPSHARLGRELEPVVRRIAHEIWEESGRPEGTADSDWHRAEELVLASRH
jgi:hypothetical protein